MNKKETLENIEEECFEKEIDTFYVEENFVGKRIDSFLSEKYFDLSRSYIQKLIKDEKIEVNSKLVKSSYKLNLDDKIDVIIPEPEKIDIKPQNIDIDIVFEDEDILIVNKKQGMVVHPAPGNPDNTLVNAIMYHCKDNLSSINGVIRPGIVHRIDKNTSGLLVIAKNNIAHQKLAEQFKEHSITREYEMICIGNVDWEEKTIESQIGRNPKDRMKMAVLKSGGRHAITHLKLVENLNGYSYIKANLETGRTHQIRVHTSFLRIPILGDDLYGYRNKKFSNLKGQTLHARKLGFIHPGTDEYIEFNSEIPDYFMDILNKIK